MTTTVDRAIIDLILCRFVIIPIIRIIIFPKLSFKIIKVLKIKNF